MTDQPLLCPSAQPNQPGALVFGVQAPIPGGGRQVSYLTETIPLTPDLMNLPNGAHPAEVLRTAAPCMNGACMNYEAGACGLAGRVARMLDPVVGSLPRCAIRPTCRWFREQGPAACLRCPQVTTNSREGSGIPAEVAYADGIGPTL